MTLRQRKGSVLALAAVLALALIVVAIGFFGVSMYFGGERETKNAGDAGALNVARKAVTVQVPLQTAGDEQQLADISEGGQASLKSINRIWAKALLVGINATQMQTDGTLGLDALTHTQSIHNAAQSISDRLAGALSNPNNLEKFYLDFTQANSTRMLGVNSSLGVGNLSGWKTSFTDRGFESNVQIADAQMPGSFSLGSLNPITNFKDPGNKYLAGYKPMQILGQFYWQIPNRFSERPHLISRSYFDQFNTANTIGPPAWNNAVPNSFSTLGATFNNQQYGQQTMAWVETNPQQIYKAAIPSGYIRVKIQANTLQWNLDGIPMDSESYGFTFDTKTSFTYPLPCGSISGTEYVGLEYSAGPTLFTAIFAQPPMPGAGSKTFDYMFQRIQEMHPGYPQSQFIAKLVSTPIQTGATDQEYVIYLADKTDPTSDVMVSTASAAPSWVTDQPDGTEQAGDSEGQFGPNWGMTELDCYGLYDYPTFTMFDGERKWTPGTGYNGCLGTVSIHRTTTAYLFGFCLCPP